MNKEALKHLDGFTGTENYYRYSPNLLFTDGVKHLMTNAQAYWLLDIIASYQKIASKDMALHSMQFWHLRQGPSHTKLEYQQNQDHHHRPAMLHYQTAPGKVAAHVTCERDSISGSKIGDTAIVQNIEFTDFPFDTLPEATIWVAPTGDSNGNLVMVAYLPSEH